MGDEKKGFTLAEVMFTVAIISILAAISIPVVLRARINANDANAQAMLKTISTACESYASVNEARYPFAASELLNAGPPYLNENITIGLHQGYTMSCTFTNTSYDCHANATILNVTGTHRYNISTGGVAGVEF